MLFTRIRDFLFLRCVLSTSQLKMAVSQTMRTIANGSAVAIVTAFLSSGIVYAGKKAVAAEVEAPPAARPECSTTSASEEGRRRLSCAPQFDGLECFETIVMTGKHLQSVKAPGTGFWSRLSTPRKSSGLALAPQFDGLHCFETFVSQK